VGPEGQCAGPADGLAQATVHWPGMQRGICFAWLVGGCLFACFYLVLVVRFGSVRSIDIPILSLGNAAACLACLSGLANPLRLHQAAGR
jgi:hypothetical protein